MSQTLKEKIASQLKDDLIDIEEALQTNLNPYLDLVRQTAGHILFSGGKRLRPLLMVLSARACGYSGNREIFFSIIFEYLHTATLLHDDLVDDAAIRRGQPAAHAVFGNPTAVLTGDFLLARALSIASQSGLTKVIHVIAGITENLSQGEIHQLLRKGDLSLSENEYMQVIHNKTAVLIQGACRVGALIANADTKQEAAMSNYGLYVGLAFQMIDDLLDYTAQSDVLGKNIGADIKEGKLTLPVIFALQKAKPADRAFMESVLRSKNFDENEFEAFKSLLNDYGGLDYTRQQASNYVEKAKAALAELDESPSQTLLMDVADYALARQY